MAENSSLNAESSAVQAHITIMQDVIRRMAENSRSCKLWCITIVAAILVLVAQAKNPTLALIALVPTLLFLILDTYYLSLEQRFRNSYDEFVENLHKGELPTSALYAIRPTGSVLGHFWKSLRSSSVLPFYPTLAVTVFIVWQFVAL